MTDYLCFLIVLITCTSSWLFSFLTIKILFCPQNLTYLSIAGFRGINHSFEKNHSNQTGEFAKKDLNNNSFIENILIDPAVIENLKPVIEAQVDIFLNEKLSKVFPLVYKMMGQKTLEQFKQTFLEEIDLLVPTLLSRYAEEISNKLDFEKIISDRIAQTPPNVILKFIKKAAGKQLLYYQLFSVFIGLLTGLLLIALLSRFQPVLHVLR